MAAQIDMPSSWIRVSRQSMNSSFTLQHHDSADGQGRGQQKPPYWLSRTTAASTAASSLSRMAWASCPTRRDT